MQNRIQKEDINNEFINGWKKSYDPSYNENVYYDNLVSLKDLTQENLQNLFEWKNETKTLWGFGKNLEPKKKGCR